MSTRVPPARDRLRADCTRCAGLCCVVPEFAASADFAFAKPAGTPCPNLTGEHRCGVHATLRERGFAGCTVFDCAGAGQQLVQVTFGGRAPDVAAASVTFPVMRVLHELLWYLADALDRPAAAPVHARLRDARRATEELAAGSADALAALDVEPHRAHVAGLLRRASELVRRGPPGARSGVAAGPGADLAGADLAGADLVGRGMRGADLRGASLRGALLLGADLRAADLRDADVIGADLRGADVRGAHLDGALYLTRMQVGAARGDARTTLPTHLEHPPHWLG